MIRLAGSDAVMKSSCSLSSCSFYSTELVIILLLLFDLSSVEIIILTPLPLVVLYRSVYDGTGLVWPSGYVLFG